MKSGVHMYMYMPRSVMQRALCVQDSCDQQEDLPPLISLPLARKSSMQETQIEYS
jgi:hypothetical protein